MSKSRHHLPGKVRAELAQVAARLMAEDGIQDYALAKKKAARQLGIAETGMLPTNREILAARTTYQDLFQEQEQRDRLQELRSAALHVMRRLERFHPYLTGEVLQGTAHRHAKIELQIFTDNLKELELFLINAQIAFKTYAKKFHFADKTCAVTCYILSEDFSEAEIAVFPGPEFCYAPLDLVERKPMRRVSIDELETLLLALPET